MGFLRALGRALSRTFGKHPDRPAASEGTEISRALSDVLFGTPQGRNTPPTRRAEVATCQPDSKKNTVGSTIELAPSGAGFPVAVVGESRRQALLRAFGGTKRAAGEEVFFTAALVPEPTNQYDPNAIMVCIQGGANGGQVGYLSAEDAVDYKAVSELLIARHTVGLCRAKLIGGTPGKPSIGILLDLADPESVLAALGPSDDQPF